MERGRFPVPTDFSAIRRHPRFPVDLPLIVTQEQGESIRGRTGNLSQGGALALLPHRIAVGTRVAVTINTDQGFLLAGGQIAWVGKTRDPQRGRLIPHGIAFSQELAAEKVVMAVAGGQVGRRIQEIDRVPVELTVSYGTRTPGVILDLSTKGLFLRTENPAPINQELHLTFSLPEHQEPIRLRGQVVWTNPSAGRNNFPPGMGIRFLSPSSEAVEAIARFVEAVRERDIDPLKGLLRPERIGPEREGDGPKGKPGEAS